VEGAEGTARAYELAHEYLIGEIALSPEAVARKEAEELLLQGVDNWERFEALLSAETFKLIDRQSDRLRLGPQAQALMLRSALRHGVSVGPWLTLVEDRERALALTQAALLAQEGEAPRPATSNPNDSARWWPAWRIAGVGRRAGNAPARPTPCGRCARCCRAGCGCGWR
jgi:hypothetical protein